MAEKLLIIRKEQMDAFDDELRKKFEQQAVIKMNKLFPDICEVLGNNKVKQKVKGGINSAKKYSIDKENDLLKYISLTFILGDDFDMDTESDYREIQKILNSTEIENPTIKLDKIFKIIELLSF